MNFKEKKAELEIKLKKINGREEYFEYITKFNSMIIQLEEDEKMVKDALDEILKEEGHGRLLFAKLKERLGIE